MRAFDMDTGLDVRVYIPGPPGPPIVDVGALLAPVAIDAGQIAAPIYRRQRSFITAVNGEVDQPTIPNPSDNGPWEFFIYVSGGHPIVLNDASNIKLSGKWEASADSMICLQWDGNSRYVEAFRNEI